MRPTILRQLLSFNDAKRLLLDSVHPIQRTEVVPLLEAAGRVAARETTATIPVPPFHRAAMDGYAVRAIDTVGASANGPVFLRQIGSAFTGDSTVAPIGQGECLAIATGAPMPDGADAVVMVEATSADRRGVAISDRVSVGQNIGARGSDLSLGDVVMRRGDVVTPGRVGALAAIGATAMEVFCRPRIAIASTGNELVPPGVPLRPGQIYNVNRFTIDAVTRRHGGAPDHFATIPDTLSDLSSALERAQSHDVIVFSGGSSVGERDLLVDAVNTHGRLIFHGIAVRPGKPTLVGQVGETLVLGLSGYPTSCLSNAYLLLVPLLRTLGHLPEWRPETVTLPLARTITSPAGRHQFYTVRIAGGTIEPAFKTSGSITSMAHADGYVEIPADIDTIKAGTPVTATLFGG